MYQNKSKIAVIVIFFIVAILLVILMVVLINNANKPEPVPEINQTELEYNETKKKFNQTLFDYKMVRRTNNYYNSNYLISPLALGYTVKILESGSNGKTKQELTELINSNYSLPKVRNIDKKISIANAVFVNTVYKGKVNNSFINSIESQYGANTMYDSFSSTDGINGWVNGKTFGLIPRALSMVDRNTGLAMVSTLTLDIEWKNKMDSKYTHSAPFTKIDNTKIDVATMYDKNNFGYLENANARGIVKHFAVYDVDTGTYATAETKNKVELEYIAILPKGNINDYIDILDQYELSRLISTVKTNNESTDLVMNIPKYQYEFGLDRIKDIFNDCYVSKPFAEDADFSNILSGLYLKDIYHKNYLELGENGTKASAVTLKRVVDPVDETKQTIQIDFNTPFIYLVKEKNSTNLWYFGIVYEPMLWDEYAKLIEQAEKEAERKKRGW